MSSPSPTQTLRQLDDLIKDVANLTGMSQRQIKEQVTTLDVPAFTFQGIVLVPSDVVDPLIDRWAADIKAKLHRGVTVASLSSNGSATPVEVINPIATSTPKATAKAAPKSKKATKAEQNGAAAVKTEAKPEQNGAVAVKTKAKSEPPLEVKPELNAEAKSEPSSEPSPDVKAESKKAEPKAEAKPKASAPKTETKLSELKLPKGFSQQVSNRYGPTLDKLLPEEFEDRLMYLKEITDESSLGLSYLNRIATVIQRKYKGRTARSTAYRGLLSKAQDMLENLKAGDAIISQLGQETA